MKVYRKEIRIRDIHELLGYADLETPINLCETDLVKLGVIVAEV